MNLISFQKRVISVALITFQKQAILAQQKISPKQMHSQIASFLPHQIFLVHQHGFHIQNHLVHQLSLQNQANSHNHTSFLDHLYSVNRMDFLIQNISRNHLISLHQCL